MHYLIVFLLGLAVGFAIGFLIHACFVDPYRDY